MKIKTKTQYILIGIAIAILSGVVAFLVCLGISATDNYLNPYL